MFSGATQLPEENCLKNVSFSDVDGIVHKSHNGARMRFQTQLNRPKEDVFNWPCMDGTWSAGPDALLGIFS